MPWIEYQVAWVGIDVEGHLIQSRFQGTLKAFKHYCQQENITCHKQKQLIIFATPQHRIKLQRRFFALLNNLLNQGYLITTALDLLAIQCKNDELAPTISIIQTGLTSGMSLSESLKQCPHLRNQTAEQLIQAGEQSQQLSAIIQRIHEQQQFQKDTRAQLKQAMIYPLCVLIGALGLTVGLLAFAIPQFASIFANFDAKLPWATQQLLNLSQLVIQHQRPLGITVSTLVVMSFFVFRHPTTRAKLHHLSRHLPLIGKIITARLQSDWSTIFAHSLSAALPLETCLSLANDTLGSAITQQQRSTLQSRLQEGDSIRSLCATLNLYSAQTLTQIDIHTRSGDLATGLMQIADAAHQTLQTTITRLSKWIEPVIMLILAIITGGLIVTLYLPIFKLGSVM